MLAHSTSDATSSNRYTTDLIRLYLREIGRVPLLGKDEEVAIAQRIQRYLRLIEQRTQAIEQGDLILQQFAELLEVHTKLTAQLGHRPSLERWAEATWLTAIELKQSLATGKRRWAEVANITVKDLEQIQRAGIKAKEQMIEANLRLVVSVAKKYQNRGLELLDLIQEGSLGLERAVDKFDPTKGYRFSTYAYWWIRQGITRAIAIQSRTIRLPVHITEKLNKIKKAQREISQKQGRLPTVEDIANELSLSFSQVRELLAYRNKSLSLDVKVGKDHDTELAELLESESVSPEEALMQASFKQELQGFLDKLTDREQNVIQMRFGLVDGQPQSLTDIGCVLNVSRERVRQIEARALQKLRSFGCRRLLRDYF